MNKSDSQKPKLLSRRIKEAAADGFGRTTGISAWLAPHPYGWSIVVQDMDSSNFVADLIPEKDEDNEKAIIAQTYNLAVRLRRDLERAKKGDEHD